mmetsp:Transcript_17098/g.15057  ORF Transcript_17098/g.15057 Transcript_17098/m.15057 type:complete len:174 (-) Transcript_17098:48-569(-)
MRIKKRLRDKLAKIKLIEERKKKIRPFKLPPYMVYQEKKNEERNLVNSSLSISSPKYSMAKIERKGHRITRSIGSYNPGKLLSTKYCHTSTNKRMRKTNFQSLFINSRKDNKMDISSPRVSFMNNSLVSVKTPKIPIQRSMNKFDMTQKAGNVYQNHTSLLSIYSRNFRRRES